MAQAILGNPKLKFIKGMFYMAPPPPQIANVGDIAYWDGSTVKTTQLKTWNSSLGTPVGVVMIPENFLPDGKARIISLTNMVYNGSENMPWMGSGNSWNDSPIPEFKYVPGTNNSDFNASLQNEMGYLSSDKLDWSGEQSFVDPLSKYYGDAPYIPSPYNGNILNPSYSQPIEGGNAMSDFNGLSNTQTLINSSSVYEAAISCWNYKDAANSNLQWYLPAIGELGFLIPRIEKINASIQIVGGIPIENEQDTIYRLWSSTETVTLGYYEEYYVWICHPCDGSIDWMGGVQNATDDYFARGVAIL